MKKNHKIAPEIKEQILRRIREDGVTVAQVSKEHGISDNTIYSWLSRSAGGPTQAQLIRLEREKKELLELVGELTVRLSQSQKKN